MKRAGNLFQEIISMENLELAHSKAKRGKGHYIGVQMVECNEHKYLGQLHEMLSDKSFTTSNYKTYLIHEPKERVIYKLPYYPDRIVQHAIMNVIQPIWDKVFIYDCYSGIPGKGIHAGLLRLRIFLHNEEYAKYCLKFDIKKYYPSINHSILLNLIQRKIKCRDTLSLLENIIKSIDGDVNVPIGNYLSQYFANIYLNWFDHWLKENNRIRYYIRYSDDGVILHQNKQYLQELLVDISSYLEEKLQLHLNSRTQIFPVKARGIDFLGYRNFKEYRLLRKKSAANFKCKMRYIENNHRNLRPQYIVSSVMSYLGWLRYCNSYNLRSSYMYNRTILEIMDDASNALGIMNPMMNYA